MSVSEEEVREWQREKARRLNNRSKNITNDLQQSVDVTPNNPAHYCDQSLSLPDADAERQRYPMAEGLLDYFPNALAAVAELSHNSNEKHNPGEPMHWARTKSTDHANKIMRHLVDRGRFDGDGSRHTARLAWRALAMLQEELERECGAPVSRGSR